MAKDTIPPPTQWDQDSATRLVLMAREDPDRVQAVVAQLLAECRWLRNMTHPEATQATQEDTQ